MANLANFSELKKNYYFCFPIFIYITNTVGFNAIFTLLNIKQSQPHQARPRKLYPETMLSIFIYITKKTVLTINKSYN